jgi:hypothetical protein
MATRETKVYGKRITISLICVGFSDLFYKHCCRYAIVHPRATQKHEFDAYRALQNRASAIRSYSINTKPQI